MSDCKDPQGVDPCAIRYVFPAPAWEKSIDPGEINIQNQELVTQNSEVSSQTEVRCWWKFNCFANQEEREGGKIEVGGLFQNYWHFHVFSEYWKPNTSPERRVLDLEGAVKSQQWNWFFGRWMVLQHLAWKSWGSDHYVWAIFPAAAKHLWTRDSTYGIRNGLICFSYQTG